MNNLLKNAALICVCSGFLGYIGVSNSPSCSWCRNRFPGNYQPQMWLLMTMTYVLIRPQECMPVTGKHFRNIFFIMCICYLYEALGYDIYNILWSYSPWTAWFNLPCRLSFLYLRFSYMILQHAGFSSSRTIHSKAFVLGTVLSTSKY